MVWFRVSIASLDLVAHAPQRPGQQRVVFGHAAVFAMQMTRHKTRAVFERYNIVSPGDLQDAAQRLDTFAGSAS